VRGIGALCCAEDAVADFVLQRGAGGGQGGDCAGELGAADPGERRLVLVFSLDLEDVEEVCSCGVDFDEIFVWGGGGCWDGGDF
jgi:hypothetical protein